MHVNMGHAINYTISITTLFHMLSLFGEAGTISRDIIKGIA